MILPFTGADVATSIPKAVAHLKSGGLLAYPTETVYGLGGDVSDASVRGVATLKGREPGKPFLLIISDPAMAEDLGLLFNASARALARACWPGPLTLALPGGSRLSPTGCKSWGDVGSAVHPFSSTDRSRSRPARRRRSLTSASHCAEWTRRHR